MVKSRTWLILWIASMGLMFMPLWTMYGPYGPVLFIFASVIGGWAWFLMNRPLIQVANRAWSQVWRPPSEKAQESDRIFSQDGRMPPVGRRGLWQPPSEK